MAALPPTLTDGTHRPASSSSNRAPTSHGRGGAGNINASPQPPQETDLTTPTLKSEHYTTGRGGSGNMAKNSDPEAARRAQDVVAQPRRESMNTVHVGRGGVANVFKPSFEGKEEREKEWEGAVGDWEGKKDEEKGEKGLADRGKEFLQGLLKK